jgi:hypothetical protein
VLLLVWPAGAGHLLHGGWVILAPALVAGVILAVRRLTSPLLRALSSPDDHLAIGATCALLALTLGVGLTGHGRAVLLAFGTLFFLYLPLGKLRHAALFFVARGEYGWRLGYRGVYPPASEGAGGC